MKSENKIKLTDTAIQFIEELKNDNNIDSSFYFRINCIGDIGAPFTYSFGFDKKEKENDSIIEFAGIKVILDKNSFENLCGSEIDYSQPDGSFKISNPNEGYKCNGTCGNH
ncbi:MAG: hypothetical protein JEY94_08705 [Melioribacteraceae bacterium]|nr:hypothetical protein [Melioribacteraceae bacterium]